MMRPLGSFLHQLGRVTSELSRPRRRLVTSTPRSTSARSTPLLMGCSGPVSTGSRRTCGRPRRGPPNPMGRMPPAGGPWQHPSRGAPSPLGSRRGVCLEDGLVADVTQLHTLVPSPTFTVSLDAISNGAIALLDEVAAGKITGEEDWWSGTDLSDFAANVQGAGVAFGAVRPLAEARGAQGVALAAEIATQFQALEKALSTYGSLEAGFVDYRTVGTTRRKGGSEPVNALAEPLSKLTHVVLGLPAK